MKWRRAHCFSFLSLCLIFENVMNVCLYDSELIRHTLKANQHLRRHHYIHAYLAWTNHIVWRSRCNDRNDHTISDSTASRLLSEVKHCRARLVLRWGTTLESLMLFFYTFCPIRLWSSPSFVYNYPFIPSFSYKSSSSWKSSFAFQPRASICNDQWAL